MDPNEANLVRLLEDLYPRIRRLLLNVLTEDDPKIRAAEIGELYQAGGGSVAELLMDLEENPAVRTTVMGTLRVMA